MENIQMVDLKGQYEKIKAHIDNAVIECIASANFINGPHVKSFTRALEAYLDGASVVPCANGTDALQIAMMALDLQPGDEVIVPSFTYVATAEVIGLLRLTPVMVDVDPETFNITADLIEQAITPKTKAVVPVHLFGQCADMDAIMKVARKYNLYVIEDTAQAIGAIYTFPDGKTAKAGTIGDIGCTSFFPSKNLGCYGDGGAIYTKNTALANKINVIANHGQTKKYVHKYIGVNSRLDSIQAAILEIKLSYLDAYTSARQIAAFRYNEMLADVKEIITPTLVPYSTHVYHQYTLKVKNDLRNSLKEHLEAEGIPAMVYYPIPLYKQEAYTSISSISGSLAATEYLCSSVLSLPIHTELTEKQQHRIVNAIKSFYKKI
ncbi:DegT/DnrJ/EryC1/StrS family aminotransferase [Chitinophaga lutea]|uniref:DegT/DnrJ/EryC1/StrS family aminotransferase n=1 Tax=Chitinophaga lutea TaxID=2488634 RepID=A0A3N4Q0U7_9BACT|nr:DegT/DnrJ/EryC1/StrS family aminotransferase [Chitinophaga lutea]RPE13225.1 DegT/DnrJ/EryC1/StrS family aminotransferase [Chitinophaga lutea]